MTHTVQLRPAVGEEAAKRPHCRRAGDAELLRGENTLYCCLTQITVAQQRSATLEPFSRVSKLDYFVRRQSE